MTQKRRRRREGDWWLGGFLLGFLVGLAMTLVYAWYLVPPTELTAPSQLDAAEKETVILLIAAAYRHDGDFKKAQRRLDGLKEKNIEQVVATQAEAYINANADPRDIRSLVTLAASFGKADGRMLAYLVTPTPTVAPTATAKPPTNTPTASPSPTVADTPTITLTPTNTPSPTRTATAQPTPKSTKKATVLPTITPRPIYTPGPNAPFELAQSIALCDNSPHAVLRVYVSDWQGNGVPGIEVLVRWPGGEDRFFTGFKPDINPGYADFEMAADQTYQVELVTVSAPVAENINPAEQKTCPGNQLSSWQVVFQQGGGR